MRYSFSYYTERQGHASQKQKMQLLRSSPYATVLLAETSGGLGLTLSHGN